MMERSKSKKLGGKGIGGKGRGRGKDDGDFKKKSLFPGVLRKKYCRFCKDKTKDIDYKNLNVLERMVNERGKIISRRGSGTCAKHQRKVAAAIKRARFLSLIPYTR